MKNSEFFCSLGAQAWQTNVKTCILFSLNHNNASTLTKFTLPTLPIVMGHNSFMFLLGLSKTTLYRLARQCKPSGSIITNGRDLHNKTQDEVNKYNSELHIEVEKAVDSICAEHAIIPPWYMKPAASDKPVCILPPMFNKHRIFGQIQKTLPTSRKLSEGHFYKIMNDS